MFQVATGAIHTAIMVYEQVKQAADNVKEVESLGNRLKQLSILLTNAEKNKALQKNADLKAMLVSCDKVGQDSSTYLNGFAKKSKASRLFGAQTHKVNFDILNKDLDRCIAYFTASLTADSNQTLNNIVQFEEIKQQKLLEQQHQQKIIAKTNFENQKTLAKLQEATIQQQQLAAAQLLAQQQEIMNQLASLKMQQTTTVASTSSTTVTTIITSDEGLSHHANVTASYIFSNGLIASGSEDSTVRIWDPNMGYSLDIIRFHDEAVNDITELYKNGIPTGYAASVSDDEKLRVWPIELPASGKPRSVKAFRGHQSIVTCVADFGNGKLATGSADKTIRIWDIDAEDVEDAQLIKIKAHTEKVTSLVAMSEDILVSTSVDRTVKAWSIDWKNKTAKLLYTLEGHKAFVKGSCKVSKNVFATADVKAIIKLWDIETGAELGTYKGDEIGLYSLTSMGLDSNILVYGLYSGNITVLDISGNAFKKIKVMNHGFEKTVFTLAAGSSRELLVSGADDNKLKLFNIKTGAELLTFTGTKADAQAKIGNGASSSTSTQRGVWNSAPVTTKSTAKNASSPPASNVCESGSPENKDKLTYVPL